MHTMARKQKITQKSFQSIRKNHGMENAEDYVEIVADLIIPPHFLQLGDFFKPEG